MLLLFVCYDLKVGRESAKHLPSFSAAQFECVIKVAVSEYMWKHAQFAWISEKWKRVENSGEIKPQDVEPEGLPSEQ